MGINSVRIIVLAGLSLPLVQQFLTSLSSVGFARTKLAVAMLTSRVASSGKVILGHKGLKVALTPFLTMHTGNLGDLEMLVAINGINTVRGGVLDGVGRGSGGGRHKTKDNKL